jgi:hypothetical protein
MDDYHFDLSVWKALFPTFERYEGGEGVLIVGPMDVLCLEHWRELVRGQMDMGSHVPTDVFVFAKGEPRRRDVTKVGGLPYRPAGMVWPRSPEGAPMVFVAQFRFRESRDLVGGLPGDVLLVFLEGLEGDVNPRRKEYAHFEWHPLGINDLVSEQDVFPPWLDFVKCYGVRHRTLDYFLDVPVDVLRRLVPPWALPSESCPEAARWDAATFSRLNGMKIGGLPVYPSGYPGREDSEEDQRIPRSARFICSLGTLVPKFEVPYPWINHPEPQTVSECLEPESILDMLDGFLFNVWIGENGSLTWELQKV